MRLVLREVSNGIEICDIIESKCSQVYSKFSQSLDYNLLFNQFKLFLLHFDL